MTELIAASLPQLAYGAKQVLENEAQVAKHQDIAMYDLMEMAGLSVFQSIQQYYPEIKSYFVICGKGNNGGDGYVVARLAHEFGIDVEVIVLAEESVISGDAKTALNKLKSSGITPHFCDEVSLVTAQIEHSNTALIVDSIFGIGFSGELSTSLTEMIKEINRHKAVKVSVDVPSGLCANLGTVTGVAVKSELTVTFIAMKKGLLTGQAANYVGNLKYADLGLERAFSEDVNTYIHIQIQENLPLIIEREPAAHKGNIGKVLAIGGNKGYPGAIRMSGEAALRCGASLVAVSCHSENRLNVFSSRPELMIAEPEISDLSKSEFLQSAKVIILGPGLGRDSWAKARFELAVSQSLPMVVDADALYFLADNRHKKDNWVLTPHPGEAARLLNCTVADVEKNRFEAVAEIANKYGGICVLKGAGTLVSDGTTIWINTTGNSGMASGGMGDVLTGVIAALMCQTGNIFEAVRLAVYIHGDAADKLADKYGKIGLLASDLFDELRLLVNR